MMYVCPVCGYTGLKEQPRSELTGCSDEICPPRGIQFGYTRSVEKAVDPARRHLRKIIDIYTGQVPKPSQIGFTSRAFASPPASSS